LKDIFKVLGWTNLSAPPDLKFYMPALFMLFAIVPVTFTIRIIDPVLFEDALPVTIGALPARTPHACPVTPWTVVQWSAVAVAVTIEMRASWTPDRRIFFVLFKDVFKYDERVPLFDERPDLEGKIGCRDFEECLYA
jgi:hypothetical protein